MRFAAPVLVLSALVSLSCTRSLDGDKFRNPQSGGDAGAGVAPDDASVADSGPSLLCGDGVCGGGENVCTCAADCGGPTCCDGVS